MLAGIPVYVINESFMLQFTDVVATPHGMCGCAMGLPESIPVILNCLELGWIQSLLRLMVLVLAVQR
jgi:hypothetical protein